MDTDPSLLKFADDVTIDENGYFVAVAGDTFDISGDFNNSSRKASDWDTDLSSFVLNGDGKQLVSLPGADFGVTLDGWIDNFAWGSLSIAPDARVEFLDGNPNNEGAALYVGVLNIEDRALVDLAQREISAFEGDANIYYNPRLAENAYLAGLNYAFANGTGAVIANVPEPAVGFIYLIFGIGVLARRSFGR